MVQILMEEELELIMQPIKAILVVSQGVSTRMIRGLIDLIQVIEHRQILEFLMAIGQMSTRVRLMGGETSHLIQIPLDGETSQLRRQPAQDGEKLLVLSAKGGLLVDQNLLIVAPVM
jgi:hypothetical protein